MTQEDEFSVDPVTRRELMQAIGSHYYNITDIDGQPMGALLVLLDRQQQPVRAELHLYDEFSDDLIGVAIRQARHLLHARYEGTENIQMQIRESFAFRESIQVPLGDPGTVIVNRSRWSPWQIGAGVAGLLLIAGLYWAISTFFRTGSTTATQAEGAASQVATETTNETADKTTVTEGNVASGQSAPQNTPQANVLPTSLYADPALTVGVRVRITPGYTLTLRSDAGAEAGEAIGYMVADPTVKLPPNDSGEEIKLFGPQATIINGPLQTKGKSDTIVWWYVEFTDGSQAWAAANTSEVTLLQPAQ